MNVVKFVAVLVALAAMAATTAQAADPIVGRWAADPSYCAGIGGTQTQSPLVVTDNSVRWSGDACRIGRVYRAGDTAYIEAFCSGGSRERAIAVTLRSHGDQLAVTWDRGVPADMRRCPKE